MKTLTAKDAKYGFGRLIDLARAEPVAVEEFGAEGAGRAGDHPRGEAEGEHMSRSRPGSD